MSRRLPEFDEMNQRLAAFLASVTHATNASSVRTDKQAFAGEMSRLVTELRLQENDPRKQALLKNIRDIGDNLANFATLRIMISNIAGAQAAETAFDALDDGQIRVIQEAITNFRQAMCKAIDRKEIRHAIQSFKSKAAEDMALAGILPERQHSLWSIIENEISQQQRLKNPEGKTPSPRMFQNGEGDDFDAATSSSAKPR